MEDVAGWYCISLSWLRSFLLNRLDRRSTEFGGSHDLNGTAEPGLAGSLSALAQGSGFALAAGPASIGLIQQLSGWTHAFLAMLALSLILALVGAWSVTGPNV